MHEGLVRFPAVARIVKSRPSDVELQGVSSIAVAAVSKDRLNDELLLIVLYYSQRIGADGIVDERAKVVDMRSDPFARHFIFDYVNRIRLIYYLEWGLSLICHYSIHRWYHYVLAPSCPTAMFG